MVWSVHDIEVKPGAEERNTILQKLHQALQELTVVHGNVLHPVESMRILGALDRGLSEELLQNLGRVINKSNPLSVFFHAGIESRLKILKRIEVNGTPVPLSKIEGFENLEQVASELVNQLELLPYDYTLYVKLPFSPDTPITAPFELAEGLNIIKADSRNKTAGTPELEKSFRDFPGRPPSFSFQDGAYYLECKTSGFIPDHFHTETVRRFIELVKSFVGLAVASMLLEREHLAILPIESEEPIGIFDGKDAHSRQDHHLSREDSGYLRSLGVRKGIIDQCRFIFMLASLGQTTLPTSEQEAIEPILKLISRAFLDSKDAETVRLSGQWYFDGLCSDHNALKFVKFTSVLEILLGGGGEEGMVLTTLMANRCAYLIGYDHNKRREIARRFEEVYLTRSRMIHQEENEISRDDEHTLAELKTLCFQVILRELGLLPEKRIGRLGSLLLG